MIILKSIGFYFAILGFILAALYSLITEKPLPDSKYFQKPSEAPFEYYIAASGIIESEDKNIEVGTPELGIVEKLWFKVGDRVKQGDPLFQIDSRALEAKLKVQEASLEVAFSDLEKQKELLKRYTTVKDPRSVSKEEMQIKDNDVKIAEAKVNEARAEIDQTKSLIARLIVRAPKDGVILQQEIREGEYLDGKKTSILLGNLEHLQMRVNIDEQNAGHFEKNSPAVAFPKNNTLISIPLTFVRIEPYVIPKKSFTGLGDEKTDTRVLQVIYSFSPPKNYNIYVGQQTDVFIKRNAQEVKHD